LVREGGGGRRLVERGGRRLAGRFGRNEGDAIGAGLDDQLEITVRQRIDGNGVVAGFALGDTEFVEEVRRERTGQRVAVAGVELLSEIRGNRAGVTASVCWRDFGRDRDDADRVRELVRPDDIDQRQAGHHFARIVVDDQDGGHSADVDRVVSN